MQRLFTYKQIKMVFTFVVFIDAKTSITYHCTFLDSSYSVIVELIPRVNVEGCIGNTRYKSGLGSCSCEDHCGWDLCRLTLPPTKCIEGTYSEWQWDDKKRAWIAQIKQGEIYSTTITL